MNLIRLRPKGQLTLPDSVRRLAHVDEGDVFEVSVGAQGIVLRPKKLVDADEAWFWTEAWQRGERRASEEIGQGRLSPAQGADDFLDSLE
ncbi:MAG: AbrB/MazE/SpoVT family DNA-binding domain-containing protein [Chloroflexota bacterium]|nr:AbrB/MazE/SpoVT family DNA-binding domain-containing protein [Chloroflexota bacterium]